MTKSFLFGHICFIRISEADLYKGIKIFKGEHFNWFRLYMESIALR